jgi:hypothetical protein
MPQRNEGVALDFLKPPFVPCKGRGSVCSQGEGTLLIKKVAFSSEFHSPDALELYPQKRPCLAFVYFRKGRGEGSGVQLCNGRQTEEGMSVSCCIYWWAEACQKRSEILHCLSRCEAETLREGRALGVWIRSLKLPYLCLKMITDRKFWEG